MSAAFNITAALVMGAVAIAALFAPVTPLSHDICLAVISGLGGALGGAAVHALAGPRNPAQGGPTS